MVPLVAVAHGSRDPRSAATVHELSDVVRAAAPGLDVRVAFLDLSAPRLADVLSAVHDEGHDEVVVVPLLLGSAYHARVDIPGVLAGAPHRLRIHLADVLGPDPRLESAALRRLAAAGADPTDAGLGVVLAAAGSSHQPANAAVRAVARRWARRTLWTGSVAAFAAAAEPDVPTAVAALRAAGARRIAVGSWFLAPGRLPDRVSRAAPGALIAAPLGADPAVAQVILARYEAAVRYRVAASLVAG
ncbi:MAG TPA: CbiX/SirB N-terminal domain-containing protein [Pseudonocardiaceae bacterium]|nr:CbiX/SirB N-terminal domain-containing protein [Pseudonocardiaceae bacterium]